MQQVFDGDTKGTISSIWGTYHGGLHEQQVQRCDAGPTSFPQIHVVRLPHLRHHMRLTLTICHTASNLTSIRVAIASCRVQTACAQPLMINKGPIRFQRYDSSTTLIIPEMLNSNQQPLEGAMDFDEFVRSRSNDVSSDSQTLPSTDTANLPAAPYGDTPDVHRASASR